MNKKKTMRKKSEITFLGMHIMNLIIAIICILILIYIGYKIYSMFSEKSDLEKAEANLKVILERTQMLKDTPGVNNIAEVLVYSPSGWLLRSYTTDFPNAECYSKKTCLCLCKEPTCANNVPKVCNGIDYIAEIPQSYEVPMSWYDVRKLAYDPAIYPNTIIFEKAVEGITLSKTDPNNKILMQKKAFL